MGRVRMRWADAGGVPMSVARQWVAEVQALRAGASRAPASRERPARDEELQRRVREVDVVITSYDIATRDVDVLAEVQWDRLLMDEAQDVKNPATKRARALRTLPAAAGRDDGHADREPVERALAIMDILNPGLLGSREWFNRIFAQRSKSIATRLR